MSCKYMRNFLVSQNLLVIFFKRLKSMPDMAFLQANSAQFHFKRNKFI